MLANSERATEEQIGEEVNEFVKKVRWVILVYVVFNVCILFLRFFGYEIAIKGDAIAIPIFIVYAVIMLMMFVVEIGLICYFYDTSMKFVRILHVEENISIRKAKTMYMFFSIYLFCAKWQYYIN